MVNLEQIYTEVDKLDKKKIMKILRALIKVQTIVPPANNYREYIDLLIPYFKELGFNTEEIIVPEELIKEILENLDIPGIPRPGVKNKSNMTPMFNLDVIFTSIFAI